MTEGDGESYPYCWYLRAAGVEGVVGRGVVGVGVVAIFPLELLLLLLLRGFLALLL